MTIEKNSVVVVDYELTIDGEIIDSSYGKEPLAFIQGTGTMIPGFDSAVLGLKVGDSSSFTVAPADGYGEFDESNLKNVDISEFPSDMELAIGTELMFETEDNMQIPCWISEVSETEVIVDFNHPLAGKPLNFKVDIREVRPATTEEMSHGHVHGAHGHHH